MAGRRTFDLVGGWGGRHPFGVPFFSADAIRQGLRAGWIDRLQLHVVPALLGGGTPLFGDVPGAELDPVDVRASTGVTHLSYDVVATERPTAGRVPASSTTAA